MAVRIVTDSSCDLAPDLCERMGIIVIPLRVIIGRDDFPDMGAEDFWTRVGTPPPFPGTSQPSPGVFSEVFEGLTSDGSEVVCITITSKHSGTFSVASTVAYDFGGKVSVWDSLSASLGQGFQVLEAAQAAQEGRGPEEILALLEGLRDRTHLNLILDTVEFLRRGGRADRVIPLIDGMLSFLKLKPLLVFKEGSLSPSGAARTQKKAMESIASSVRGYGPLERLGVMHTRCPEAAESLAQVLSEQIGFPEEEIWRVETGSVLSSHAGPGALAAIAIQARTQKVTEASKHPLVREVAIA